MNYKEACKYINGIPKFTSKNSLEHTRELLELLGNPQEQYKVVHVAGTNGKGSTCAYISNILQTEGYDVGLFSSPHLTSMTERIRMNGQCISQEDFAAAFDEVMLAFRVLENRQAPHPSFFEFLFVMGMLVFAKARVQYVVLETGLGGRLDATNAVEHPLLSVITSISMDHMQYLGDTVEEIATEKAGIIKEHGLVVYQGDDPMVSKVISYIARIRQAKTIVVTKDTYNIEHITQDSIAFALPDVYDKGDLWKIPTGAIYQVENAALAIYACRQIIQYPSYERMQKAIERTNWPGRMEKIDSGIYMDGAHNIGAMKAFSETVKETDVILFSAVSDKNYEEMIQWLCNHVHVKTYVITSIEDERGESAERLAEIFARYTQAEILVRKDLKEAWKIALEHKTDQGTMYGLGSLYLIGMIRKLLQEAN